MAVRRSSALRIVRPRYWQRQTAWDTPVAQSEMLQAINVTSRNYVAVDETNEEIHDCTGEEYLFELLLGRFARLTIEMDVDPDELAGWMALGLGTAASPSGGTNEVQTETVTGATSGTIQYRFTNNFNLQISAPIAFNANAAARTAALEAMSNIGATNVIVTGTGPYVITFQGALADANLGLIEVVSALNPGATDVIVETTPGVGRTHALSRLGAGLYTLPYTTLYVGYQGSAEQPVIFKNVVVNSVRVRSASREKVTAVIELIGSADLQQASGFTIPACVDIEPVRFGDCSLIVNGQDLYLPGSTYGVENNGVAVARSWEFLHQNDILTGNYAFTTTGVDVSRLDRADRRPNNITYAALGEPYDTLFNMGKAKNTVPMSLRIGPTSNYVRVNVPWAVQRLDNPQINHEGEANESHLRLIGRPRKISGDATTPFNVTAVTSQTTAYLAAA